MSEVDSGFTTKGYENTPNLHNDNEYLIPMLSELPSERLSELQKQYTEFLSSDVLPHHRTQAERFLAHVDFEQRWRGGEFESEINSV